jgi:hypothetical protein
MQLSDRERGQGRPEASTVREREGARWRTESRANDGGWHLFCFPTKSQKFVLRFHISRHQGEAQTSKEL